MAGALDLSPKQVAVASRVPTTRHITTFKKHLTAFQKHLRLLEPYVLTYVSAFVSLSIDRYLSFLGYMLCWGRTFLISNLVEFSAGVSNK